VIPFLQTKALRKKLEKQKKVEKEVSGGKGVWAVGGKITKTVRVIAIHAKPVDEKIRRKVTKTTSVIARLWKEEATTSGERMWILSVVPGRERKDESVWTVERVPEEVPGQEVAKKVWEGIKADGWDDKERTTVRIPQGPPPGAMGRKEMYEMLRKENPGIKLEGRLPEPWGKPKMTGIEFSVKDVTEAKRLAFKGMKWNSHYRRVGVVTNATDKTPARVLINGPRPGTQAARSQNWRAPTLAAAGWRGKSAVQYFNCQGYGRTYGEGVLVGSQEGCAKD